MCGIIGYIGPKEVVPVLIEGLRRLEYRGYDSAGVAVVQNGCVNLRRSAGKQRNIAGWVSERKKARAAEANQRPPASNQQPATSNQE